MTRALLVGVAFLFAIAPGWAVTEQRIADELADDLGAAAATAYGSMAIQQVRLTVGLRLAADKQKLEMQIALKELAADLAVASARLSVATPKEATEARHEYISDVTHAINKYQQGLSRIYSAWAQDSAQVYQSAQQDAAQALQQGPRELVAAQQRTQQSMLGADWGKQPPAIAPTLPDLTGQIDLDARRIAGAEKTIHGARLDYQADIADTMAACDDSLKGALALPLDDMPGVMRDIIRELKAITCGRFQDYDAEVRDALRTVTSTGACGL